MVGFELFIERVSVHAIRIRDGKLYARESGLLQKRKSTAEFRRLERGKNGVDLIGYCL
jgi:hypothetical protein